MVVDNILEVYLNLVEGFGDTKSMGLSELSVYVHFGPLLIEIPASALVRNQSSSWVELIIEYVLINAQHPRVLFELIWRDYFRFLSIKCGNSLFHLGMYWFRLITAFNHVKLLEDIYAYCMNSLLLDWWSEFQSFI